MTENRTGVEWYNSAFFECTGNISSIGQGLRLLVDGEEEVSVDSNISSREVVFQSCGSETVVAKTAQHQEVVRGALSVEEVKIQ